MRKLLISLLLVTAGATPALADPPSRADREQAREERQQAREQRQQSRSERSGGDAPQVSPQLSKPAPVQQPAQVQQQSSGGGKRDMGAIRDSRRDAQGARSETVQDARELRADQREQLRQDRAESRRTDSDHVAPGPKIVRPQAESRESRSDKREQLRQDRVEARELRQSTRPVPPVMRTRTPVVSNVPREGTQPPPRVDNRHSTSPKWSTNWRHNNKYDWHNWRKRHRSRFHLGFYYDPFGWGYSPYQIGWRLWPSYYSSRYWLNDPWQYRLPYAPPGYRWIRYWNDAVLVDTWSGQVVDVIYNFFW